MFNHDPSETVRGLPRQKRIKDANGKFLRQARQWLIQQQQLWPMQQHHRESQHLSLATAHFIGLAADEWRKRWEGREDFFAPEGEFLTIWESVASEAEVVLDSKVVEHGIFLREVGEALRKVECRWLCAESRFVGVGPEHNFRVGVPRREQTVNCFEQSGFSGAIAATD